MYWIGCGTGLPYDKYFSDNGFSVTGVDISKKHIELAKKNVEDGKFINDDFFSEEIEGKYDAITSFYAIFHIPRKEHKRLLERIHSLLSDKGYILITLGSEDMEYDTESDFVGASMAWSSYSVEENKRLVREAGFEIIIAAEVHKKEDHLWILGKKK